MATCAVSTPRRHENHLSDAGPDVGKPRPPVAAWGIRASEVVALGGAIVLLLATIHFGTRQLSNGDLFTLIRTGDITLATHTPPGTDPFSYTVAGAPWNNHEWGFAVIAAVAHRVAGFTVFRWLVLLMVGGVLAATGALLVRRAGLPLAVLATVLSFLFVANKFIPAPQTVSMVLFFVAFRWFRGPALFSSKRRTAALVVVLFVWANLTAEVVTFLPFLLFDQCSRLGEGLAPGLPRRRVLVLLALAVAATLITPPCSSVPEYALVGTAINRQVNSEFTHLWEQTSRMPPFVQNLARGVVLGFLAYAAGVLVLARGRRMAALRRVGPGLMAVAAAALFERNFYLLILPVSRLTVALAAWAAAHSRRALVAGGAALAAPAALALALWGLWSPAFAWRTLTSRGYWTHPLHAETIPLSCAERLAAVPAGSKILAPRLWASYVILRVPQARIFIDGRNREYPLAIHRAADNILGGAPAALHLLSVTGTDVVLATPEWGDLPGIRTGPWRRRFADRTCAIYARSPKDLRASPGPAPPASTASTAGR
jgi:hypothetical protein